MQLAISVYGRSHQVDLSKATTPKQVVGALHQAHVPLRAFVAKELDNPSAGWQQRMADKIRTARTPDAWAEVISPIVNGQVVV